MELNYEFTEITELDNKEQIEKNKNEEKIEEVQKAVQILTENNLQEEQNNFLDVLEINEQQIEKTFLILDKIRNMTLKRIAKNNIINIDNKPYIMESAINLFLAPYGIYEKNIECYLINSKNEKINIKTENAFKEKIKGIYITGIIGSKLLKIETYIEGGIYITDKDAIFHNIDDIIFWIKKARANWRGRSIKKLLALDNIGWDDLASVGIKKEDVKVVEYKKKKNIQQDGNQDVNNVNNDLNNNIQEIKEKLKKMLRELYNNDINKINQTLINLTTYKDENGTEIKGDYNINNYSEKKLRYVYSQIKKFYENKRGELNDK